MKTKPLVYKTSPGSLELRLELLARELYFRSDGGVISKIITDKGEPTHVLNIKRGILSAFQLKIIGKDDTINEVSGNLLQLWLFVIIFRAFHKRTALPLLRAIV